MNNVTVLTPDLMTWAVALEAEGMEDHIQEMREVRVGLCGKWYIGTSPRSGKKLMYQSRCNLYRLCETCRQRIAGELADRIWSEEEVYIGEFTEESWASIRSRWKRWGVEYLKLPVSRGVISNLGSCFLVAFNNPGCRKDAHISIDVSTMQEKYELNLVDVLAQALERMPEGRRRSGKLGYVMKEQHDSDAELVHIEVVHHDGGTEVGKAAWKKAVEQTDYLDPQTPEEVQEACAIRTNAFKKAIEELGARITDSFWQQRYVCLDDICWHPIRDKRTPQVALNRQSLGWYKSRVPIGVFPAMTTDPLGRK